MAPIKRKRSPRVADAVAPISSGSPIISLETPPSDADADADAQESSPTPESPSDGRSLRQTTLNFKRSPRRPGPAANVLRHIVQGQKKKHSASIPAVQQSGPPAQEEPAPPPRKRGRPRKYPLPPEEAKKREEEDRRKAEEKERLIRKREAEEEAERRKLDTEEEEDYDDDEEDEEDEDEEEEEDGEEDDDDDDEDDDEHHIIEINPEEDEVVLVGQPIGASDDEDMGTENPVAFITPHLSPDESPPPPTPHIDADTDADPVRVATSATATTATEPSPAAGNSSTSVRSDRNIDRVVFGDLEFRTWYQSPYCREVLGLPAGGNKKRKTPLLDRLYVCPTCFKYARELLPWLKHLRFCCGVHMPDGSVVPGKGGVPGRKVYRHPRVHGEEEGEWSVWEVDGERDSLFCQNLSLFGKLFLDTKSVFFDVTNFNFFLLVYTPAASSMISAPRTKQTVPATIPRIVGFFSKEKMSWDNNNLACILIFPPWQRKGLGALLMGVSYEIARRERILGGPEKPISDLGLKGYKRFWAGEIARWLLSLAPKHDAASDDDDDAGTRRLRSDELPDPHVVVDIHDCSMATWITPDDCLATLRDMNIAEPFGTGPPIRRRKHLHHVQHSKTAALRRASTESAKSHTPSASGAVGLALANADPAVCSGSDATDDDDAAGLAEPVSKVRVCITTDAVRKWVADHKINLQRPCDPDGFVEGYAIKQETDESGESTNEDTA